MEQKTVNRYVVSRAMSKVRKPDFVLRNSDRMGRESFEKWLLILREGFQDGIVFIDNYLQEEN